MVMATDTVMDTVMDIKMKADRLRHRLLPGMTLALVSFAAMAQQNIPGSIAAPALTGAAGAKEAASTLDADAPALGRGWTIQPRISLTETLTDNVNINRASGNKQSDLITELAPGIRIQAQTARLKGYFDYALRGFMYASQPDYNNTQNALNTFGTLEAIDDWFFLDFNGRISQQAISAFGAQSPGTGSVNGNVTETSSFGLSPYIRGQLGGLVEYSLRYKQTINRSDASSISNIDLSQWVGQLQGGTPFNNLRWAIDANQQTAEYSSGRKTDADQFRGVATYTLLPEFRVSLSAGRESNNYATQDQESRNTHGYGFDWNPTARTQLSVFKERRFFGDGHRISFNHRFPLSSIRYTDTRDVSVLPDQFGLAGMGTVYDMYFQQFASLIPDPVARAAFVQAFLTATNIDPNTQVIGGFLSSRATLQRRQELAFTLHGVRNTLTVMANRSESQSTLAATAINDDFTRNSLNAIEQRGISVNFSHRLTQLANLNLLASRQSSTGSGTSNNLETTTTMYQVTASTKLSAKTTGSLSLRRAEFDSTTTPYTENALIGTLIHAF